MKHGFIKVAAISPKIKVADPAYNAGVIVEKMKEAYEKGAKILVFPELVSQDIPVEIFSYRKSF